MPTMHAEILRLKNVREIITQGMATTLTLQGSNLPRGAFAPNPCAPMTPFVRLTVVSLNT